MYIIYAAINKFFSGLETIENEPKGEPHSFFAGTKKNYPKCRQFKCSKKLMASFHKYLTEFVPSSGIHYSVQILPNFEYQSTWKKTHLKINCKPKQIKRQPFVNTFNKISVYFAA